MSKENSKLIDGTWTDRRTILKQAATVAGGLSVTGAGTVIASEKPFEAAIDATGLERYLPCTDEIVTVTQGIVNVKIHTTVDSDGGVHFSYHSHWDPKPVGVGLDSGIQWTGQGTKSITETVRPPFPATVTRVDNSIFTSKGSAPNFIYRLRTHTTVTDEGEVVEMRYEQSLECTGGVGT